MKRTRSLLAVLGILLIPGMPGCDDPKGCENAFDDVFEYSLDGTLDFKDVAIVVDGSTAVTSYYEFCFDSYLLKVCGESVLSISYFLTFTPEVKAHLTCSFIDIDGEKYHTSYRYQAGYNKVLVSNSQLPIIRKASPAEVSVRIGFGIRDAGSTKQEVLDKVSTLFQSFKVIIEYKKLP